MRVVPQLAWRLLLGSGGRGALTTVLSAVAVAIATGFLLLTLGVALGFNQRADREAWLSPIEAESNPTAMIAVTTDYVRGTAVAVVDLAALDNDVPVPPGLDRFPEPGEVFVSPAIADLVSTLPPDELEQRYVATDGSTAIAGEIGQEALVYKGQLMVITGRDPDWFETSLAGTNWMTPWFAEPTAINRFDGESPFWLEDYNALSAFAVALLVVPLFVLGTAAGRLATTYRDRRLAAMRLVGATPGQVRAITMFETMLVGLGGALVGTAVYILTLPLAARVEATGGAWFVGDLWVGWPIVAATLVAVPVIVCFSALLGLRKLIISPLGVARRQQPKGATIWRGLLFLVLLAAYAVIAPTVQRAEAVVFGVFFGILFLGFSIMGPFVVRLLGYAMTLLARKPATLLAGRRVLDDPHAVWRIVGGITLTGFVAGFLTVMIPGNLGFADYGSPTVGAYVARNEFDRIAAELDAAFVEAGINAEVEESYDAPTGEASLIYLSAVLHTEDEADQDRVITIFSTTEGLSAPAWSRAYDWRARIEMMDVYTASLLVLTVTLAVASASAMINGVTGVLDRRQTLSSLRLAGTPLNVLDSARIRETIVPFLILGAGAIGAGVFAALPLYVLARSSVMERVDSYQQSYALILVPLAVAVVGLTVAEIASRVTLRSATANPTANRIL